MAALCSYYEYSSTATSSRWILRSRGNVDMTTRDWPRVEMPEASSYSWCLQVANQQRMAARRALEWIRMLKAQLDLKMKYQTCLIRRILNLATTKWHYHYDISVMVSCYPTFASPLVCTHCPLRCDCLGACRVAICFSQSAHHILSLVIFFPSQKERRILISHSLGSICRSLSWSTGTVHSLPGTWVAGWSCRVKYWRNLIWSRLPNHQIKKPDFPAVR